MPRTTILRRLVATTRPAPITTLRHLVARAIVRAVTCCLLLAAPVVAIYSLPGIDFGVGSMTYAAPETAGLGEPSNIDRLVERHGCWTDAPPADMVGEIPGGVIMSRDGGSIRFYGSDTAVGDALDHVFGATDATIGTVVGFCR